MAIIFFSAKQTTLFSIAYISIALSLQRGKTITANK